MIQVGWLALAIFKIVSNTIAKAANLPKTKVPSKTSANHPLYGYAFPKQHIDTKLAVGKHDIPQSTAKALLPPSASIWRQNRRGGGWHVHMKPHKRRTFSWAKYGNDSAAACKAAIKHCWTLWLADNELPTAHCPIEGLAF